MLKKFKMKVLKKAIHISATFALFVLLSGCFQEWREKTTVVEGIVINSGTKEPIEGVVVTLMDGFNYSSDPLGMNADLASGKLYRTETDANGAFKAEISGIHDAFLGLSMKNYSYEYIDEGSTQGIRPFTNGNKHKNVVLEMDAEAFFAPFLKSNVPVKQGEKVFIETSSYGMGGYSRTGFDDECTGKTICPAYDYIPFRAKGDKYLLYKLEYTRDSTIVSVIDSVYIKSFETFRDTIYY